MKRLDQNFDLIRTRDGRCIPWFDPNFRKCSWGEWRGRNLLYSTARAGQFGGKGAWAQCQQRSGDQLYFHDYSFCSYQGMGAQREFTGAEGLVCTVANTPRNQSDPYGSKEVGWHAEALPAACGLHLSRCRWTFPFLIVYGKVHRPHHCAALSRLNRCRTVKMGKYVRSRDLSVWFRLLRRTAFGNAVCPEPTRSCLSTFSKAAVGWFPRAASPPNESVGGGAQGLCGRRGAARCVLPAQHFARCPRPERDAVGGIDRISN